VKCIINNQVVLSRPLEGPLAVHIGSFAEWASEQGYALCSLRRQVLIAACFSRWLGQNGVRLRNVSTEHAATVSAVSRSTGATSPGRRGGTEIPD
jgi:integrase/recombinase XerD